MWLVKARKIKMDMNSTEYLRVKEDRGEVNERERRMRTDKQKEIETNSKRSGDSKKTSRADTHKGQAADAEGTVHQE